MSKVRLMWFSVGLVLLFLGIAIPFYSLCSLSLDPLGNVPENCNVIDTPQYLGDWWNHPIDRIPYLILLIADIVLLIIPGSWFIYISEKKFPAYLEKTVDQPLIINKQKQE